MYIKLDSEVISILCCPLCKGNMEVGDQKFVCRDCATEYPARSVPQKDCEDYVFDFRIYRPLYCEPVGLKQWSNVQEGYENFSIKYASIDDFKTYLDEIDSVKEIYTEEFRIKGRVLDVGGHQGRLRHFLKDEDVPLYISVDPYLEIFQNIESQPNLTKAYPCLSKPCNFLSCHAENLPFVKNTFDWVHMRSVLDHFQDPYLALKEAYRVLRTGGTLLIGLTVHGGQFSLRLDRSLTLFFSWASRINKKIHFAKDHHMFHWNYDDLIDLLRITRFETVKKHWQKPPFNMCIYLSAIKK